MINNTWSHFSTPNKYFSYSHNICFKDGNNCGSSTLFSDKKILSKWQIDFILLNFTLCYPGFFFQNSMQEFYARNKIWNPKFNFNRWYLYLEVNKGPKKKKKSAPLNQLNWLNQWMVINNIYVSSNLCLINFNRM